MLSQTVTSNIDYLHRNCQHYSCCLHFQIRTIINFSTIIITVYVNIVSKLILMRFNSDLIYFRYAFYCAF